MKRFIMIILMFMLIGLSFVNCGQKKTAVTQPKDPNPLFLISVDGKYGYIDKTGKIVINPQFDDGAGSFSEGLASVEIGDKWGFIDKTGKYVINPRFFYACSFSEGLAWVKIGDWKTGYKTGYIDKTGKYIWEPTK